MQTRTMLMTSVALLTMLAAPAALAEKPFTLTNTSSVTSSETVGDTAAFVRKASVGGIFEIESSQVALEKSQNPEVKKFAQMMIDDHKKTNDKLKALLHEKKQDNLVVGALDKQHRVKLDALVHSKNFDADYLKAQADGHNTTIALFETYAEDGTDNDLKSFAEKTLPTLKEHKEHLEKIRA